MAGQRGAQGVPGESTPTVTRQAAADTSALRLVYESQALAYLVDPAAETIFQVVGISLNGAALGADLAIQTEGFIDDSGCSWTEGLVFAGPNGTLTQTPPTSGYELVVGTASSPTRLNIHLEEPVLLA
ncbi:hypothetical protein PMM47T1_13815 [Pseudomonas sp. M47T1]|uniref:hypothetical protein n=1 Tax=Pseudomonas sp. M47T1 TaxID=1179778 RepID=UPI00026085DE|nr:hypothetical protein [Pseudomonas sp. M47T1]EIK96041.1 hypothetical protein PMM47T1_13815 [Pseudomonas sp. M47T1]